MGLAGLKVMVSPERQVTGRVAVGARVFVAEGVNVGPRVRVGAGRRVAVGHGRRVAVGNTRRVAVACDAGVASGETESAPTLLEAEGVAVGVEGGGVTVAVLVIHSVGVRVAVDVRVGDGVAVGSRISVARAREIRREAPRPPMISATTARKAQTASATRAKRPPPTRSDRRAGWRAGGTSAAL
jgi:UDP-3-O-[3-hydroxymyristoyl] glucosamine N-acyltransferase